MLHHPAPAEDAHDARRGPERHEHQGQPAVLVDVADGLAPGPGAVDVGDPGGRQDGQVRGEALGGDVDVLAVGGRRGDEEERLGGGPFGEGGGEVWIELHFLRGRRIFCLFFFPLLLALKSCKV